MADTSSPPAVAGQAGATTQARQYAWQTYMTWKDKNGECWESFVLEMEGHKGKDAENELMGPHLMGTAVPGCLPNAKQNGRKGMYQRRRDIVATRVTRL